MEERFVDAMGMIEYWMCTMCHRRWTVSLPPIESHAALPRGTAAPRPHRLDRFPR